MINYFTIDDSQKLNTHCVVMQALEYETEFKNSP